MAAVRAWLEGIVGLWMIAAAIVFTNPVFKVIDALAVMFGADQHPTYQFIKTTMQYVLIPIGISILIHAFSSATRTEEESYVYGFR